MSNSDDLNRLRMIGIRYERVKAMPERTPEQRRAKSARLDDIAAQLDAVAESVFAPEPVPEKATSFVQKFKNLFN